MILNLTTSREFQLQFDPVATEDRFPSVAFDITAEFSMPFQRANVSIKECWFSQEKLRQFEQDLAALVESSEGRVTLDNMSEKPILTIERNGSRVITCVTAGDTAGIGNIEIRVNGYATEIREMLLKLREYPKWW